MLIKSIQNRSKEKGIIPFPVLHQFAAGEPISCKVADGCWVLAFCSANKVLMRSALFDKIIVLLWSLTQM